MRWGSSAGRGWRAERLAAAELERRGYRIVRFNYRGARGEIDIVARDGSTLCFVEVRSRQSATFGHPLETVDHRKRARLVAAAAQYLSQWPRSYPAVRFDVVSVVYRPRLEFRLVQDAFGDSGAHSGRHRWP